jgi:photosystem II stability/assembly factor-like uncharacterized protein
LRQTKVAVVLAALLLAFGAAGCADKAFEEDHGPPPPASPGLGVWIVSARSIWHTANGGADWEQQLEQAPRTLTGIAFADGKHGWAVGTKGLILATSDGGRTWNAQTSTGPHLWHVTCVDAKHVWAIGPHGALLRSSNGGSTWRTDEIAGVDMVDSGGGGITFADASHGWIATGDAVRASSDGGATWAVQYQRKGIRLRGVACSDSEHVWAVGTRGGFDGQPVVIATTDGGATWTDQHVGRPGLTYGNFALSSVACSGDRLVWAGSNSQHLFALTRDGGRTWRVEELPDSASVYAMAAVDAEHVILTTNGQPVLFSGDAGLTWNASGRSGWLEDAAHGVAALWTEAE